MPVVTSGPQLGRRLSGSGGPALVDDAAYVNPRGEFQSVVGDELADQDGTAAQAAAACAACLAYVPVLAVHGYNYNLIFDVYP